MKSPLILYKTNDENSVNLIQNRSIELSLALSLPAAFGLLIASEDIVNSLFGYGSFDQKDILNTSLALIFFALGVPAFALAKVLSNFYFARDNTKMPFYISLISMIINIIISVSFFKDFGFIIIPISTTISSWINALLLFFYLQDKNYFKLNLDIIFKLLRIFCAVILSSYFFYLMTDYYSQRLIYESNYKLIYVLLLVIITLFLYVLISIFTKAFKLSDIKLKY